MGIEGGNTSLYWLLFFTPLENPTAYPVRSSVSIGGCSRDEDGIPLSANTEFKASFEPPVKKSDTF